MTRVLRCLVVGVALAGCGSVSVVRIPLTTTLGERETAPPSMVSGLKVAVARPLVKNDPEKRADLTSEHAESYPSQSHQAMTVPQALREVGFEVIEVARAQDAAAYGVDYVLDLTDPTVAAFHPAQGGRVTLVGSAYDVHVTYRGALKDARLHALGVVEGHGQGTKRFMFMEPLAKAAFVGGLVSLATMGAAILSLVIMVQFGLLTNVATKEGAEGDILGICTTSSGRFPGTGSGNFSKAQVCGDVVNYGLYTAFISGIALSTAVAGGLAGALGENVFDVFLAAMHISWVDPAWRGMVQGAHDDAARSLADALATRAMADRARPPSPALLPSFAPADRPGAAPQAQPTPQATPADAAAPAPASSPAPAAPAPAAPATPSDGTLR